MDHHNTPLLIKVLLWAGIEDYCPLYEALWEINALVPSLPQQERQRITYQLISSLLDAGDIAFIWLEDDIIGPIASSDAHLLMEDPENWIPHNIGGKHVCFDTTPQGQAHYRAISR